MSAVTVKKPYGCGDKGQTVTTFRLLGTHISGNLSWTHHNKALVKKAQQRLHSRNLDKKLLLGFYHSSVESVLTYCLGVWYIGSTAEHRKSVQRVINTTQKIITGDLSHPAHHLFDWLPSGRRFRSIKSHTSFFPWTIWTAKTWYAMIIKSLLKILIYFSLVPSHWGARVSIYLVPVPSQDKLRGLRQEGHPA